MKPNPWRSAFVAVLSFVAFAGGPGVRAHGQAPLPARAHTAAQFVKAYVVVKNPLTLEAIEDQVGNLNRRERRAATVERLKRHAAIAQADLRETLKLAEQRGDARAVRSLWMGNSIILEASPAFLADLETRPDVARIGLETNTSAWADSPCAPASPPLALPGNNPAAHLPLLQVPALWNIGIDGAGLVAGHIDFGFEYTHPDLVNHVWTNPAEIPGNLVDDDSNGYVDDTVGWDFWNGDNDPWTTLVHGTSTAGLLVGDGTSGITTGVATGAKLIVLRVLTEVDYWEAQQYCLDQGADIVCSSRSFKWSTIPPPDYHMFRLLCDMELAAGVIHANSVGNEGLMTGSGFPVPFNIGVPANCPPPFAHPDNQRAGRSSVIGVGGIHIADESLYLDASMGPAAWEDLLLYDPLYPHAQDPAYFDYPHGGFGGGLPGLLKPDISAFTDLVTSTTSAGGYDLFTGTSSSTPQVGGALLLLLDVQPEALPRHLAAAIELTAKDLGPTGKDNRFGAGKLRAFDAARRLVVLGKMSDVNPGLGDPVTLDLYGETNGLVFSWVGVQIVSAGVDFNLVPPVILFGAFGLGPTGHKAIPLTIPNDPFLIGLPAFLQFASPVQNTAAWGPKNLFSVPELLEIGS